MCKYCGISYNNKSLFDGETEDECIPLRISIYKTNSHMLSVFLGGKIIDEQAITINYCPMCGRDFKEETK